MVALEIASLAEFPSPLHITLLFKCAKHTILLSVLPSTPFSDIKSLLLLALQARNIKTINNDSVPAPDQGDQVEFGIPRNKKDLKKGFISPEMAEQVPGDSKGGKKKVNGNKAMPSGSPASAGLVDGSVLAFRFKQGEAMDMEDAADDEAQVPNDPGWNVELPHYDEEDE